MRTEKQLGKRQLKQLTTIMRRKGHNGSLSQRPLKGTCPHRVHEIVPCITKLLSMGYLARKKLLYLQREGKVKGGFWDFIRFNTSLRLSINQIFEAHSFRLRFFLAISCRGFGLQACFCMPLFSLPFFLMKVRLSQTNK